MNKDKVNKTCIENIKKAEILKRILEQRLKIILMKKNK